MCYSIRTPLYSLEAHFGFTMESMQFHIAKIFKVVDGHEKLSRGCKFDHFKF